MTRGWRRDVDDLYGPEAHAIMRRKLVAAEAWVGGDIWPRGPAFIEAYRRMAVSGERSRKAAAAIIEKHKQWPAPPADVIGWFMDWAATLFAVRTSWGTRDEFETHREELLEKAAACHAEREAAERSGNLDLYLDAECLLVFYAHAAAQAVDFDDQVVIKYRDYPRGSAQAIARGSLIKMTRLAVARWGGPRAETCANFISDAFDARGLSKNEANRDKAELKRLRVARAASSAKA
jgi:hypothetical protein